MPIETPSASDTAELLQEYAAGVQTPQQVKAEHSSWQVSRQLSTSRWT
eukprot:CAMPEP_0198735040 /NCGR_PEP_ID=MMETSP1475-20131203/56896_1 /TAXON_ID= ORGANISM="Unidentified sp., Strain CCMP1999" /NCGR_SAMPLE_ID=MMETSP1475 /ASSEMBLY_ACC=CAM_ASM_001111 /LENGTH=47 /DNA_ID= /DNA_START= /DNA_END= /DNA_ORIENTATION=